MSETQPRLNQFYPHNAIKYDGEYWHSRPELVNELVDHFDYHYFCRVVERDELDTAKYKQFSPDITVHDFFKSLSRTEYIRNRHQYRQQIEAACDMQSDLFLINYPFMKTSMVLAHQLQDTNLTIWVLADYVGQFDLHDQGPLKNTIKKIAKPFVSVVYPWVSRKLFDGNLVLYSGDKLYNIDDNHNQHEITEVHSLNTDPERIQRLYCNEVAFVGRENRQKGIDLAIKAVNEFDHDITLNIIGFDSLSNFTHLDTNNVEFHGTIYEDEAFFDILADNDFLLMPSTAEKQGKVQLEAMSAGVVPICADSGGIPFTVEHNYNGLLFKERSLNGLVDSLRRGYNSPELYQRLIDGGIESTSKLDVSTQGQKIASIIKNHYRT